MPESDAYADDSPLVHLFGQPARTRLLAVVVANRDREFSKSELAEHAGVARSTVYNHLDDLLALGVIEAVGSGQRRRYQFND